MRRRRYRPLPMNLRLAGAMQETWMQGVPFVPGPGGTAIDWERWADAVLDKINTTEESP